MKKTKYLIWKNPACDGINPKWRKITGEEFYALVRLPESKGRYFIKLHSILDDGSDGAIVIEATKADYVQWRKDKDHSCYIRKQSQASGIKAVSYHAFENDEGKVSFASLSVRSTCREDMSWIL